MIETQNKFAIFRQINEILNFCLYDIEKITHKMISDLRENVVLSAVGYKIGNSYDNEKVSF